MVMISQCNSNCRGLPLPLLSTPYFSDGSWTLTSDADHIHTSADQNARRHSARFWLAINSAILRSFATALHLLSSFSLLKDTVRLVHVERDEFERS